MRKRKGMGSINFWFFTFITVCLIAAVVSSVNKVYYYGKPDVKAEIQLKQCAEKIGFGSRFIVVELPVLDDTERRAL